MSFTDIKNLRKDGNLKEAYHLAKQEMVEASEFPELSAKYGVSSVPQMVINDGANSFVGALPEAEYLDEVMKVL